MDKSFKYGQLVEVSNNGTDWAPGPRLFVRFLPDGGALCVVAGSASYEAFFNGLSFEVVIWGHIRHIRPDLKKGAPIKVREREDLKWEHRHFTGWGEDGRIMTTPEGRTPWSIVDWSYPGELIAISWNFYELPTAEETGEI